MAKSPTQLYRHFNAENELLYVGISINAPNRQSQHKHASRWFKEVTRIEIESYEYREQALQIERNAIETEKPKYNIQHQVEEPRVKDYSVTIENSETELVHHIVSHRPLYNVTDAASILNLKRKDILDLICGQLIGSVTIGENINVSGWQIIEFIEAMSSESYAEEVKMFLREINTPADDEYIGRSKAVWLFGLNGMFFSGREKAGLQVPSPDKNDEKDRCLYLVQNLRDYFAANSDQLAWYPSNR